MINSTNKIYIYVDESKFITLPLKSDFKKVSDNILKIKKQSKIYNEYKIPTNENILAFCKNSFLGLAVSGVIFTNKAFYYKNDKDEGRICYLDLCKYVVLRQFDIENGAYLANHGGVFLQNHESVREVFLGTLIAKNIAAEEVLYVLENIQKNLCEKFEFAKKGMEITIKGIFDSYRVNMRKGQHQTKDDILLRTLQSQKSHYREATLLFSEMKYRLCDFHAYYDYINNTPIIDDEFKKELSDPKALFYDSYIEDLSNLNFEIDVKFLETVTDNVTKYKDSETSEEMYVIGAFAFIRTNEFNCAEKLITVAEERFGPALMEYVVNFKFVYGNRRMQEVYNNIAESKEIPESKLGCKDSLGFTPLHYKMIFCEKDGALGDILDYRNWSGDFLCGINKEVADLYDYTSLAFIKKRMDINEIIIKTNNDILTLNNELDQVFEQKESASNAITEIGNCLHDARRRLAQLNRENGSFTEISNVTRHIDELTNSYEMAKNMYFNCKEKIIEIESEISKKIKKKKMSILAKLNNIKINPSVLGKIIFQFYTNTNSIYNIKNFYASLNENSMKVYEYNGFRFLMPDSVILDLPFYTIHVDSSGKIHTKNQIPHPTYGKSWFSEQAHGDFKILSKEYRQLAKIYHPDVCTEPYADKLFSKISEEYNDIDKNI